MQPSRFRRTLCFEQLTSRIVLDAAGVGTVDELPESPSETSHFVGPEAPAHLQSSDSDQGEGEADPFAQSGNQPAEDCHHNSAEPNDVNGDSVVSNLDALALVNALNTNQVGRITAPCNEFQVDTNNDGDLTPQDLLQVANALNFGEAGPASEATPEFSSTPLENEDSEEPEGEGENDAFEFVVVDTPVKPEVPQNSEATDEALMEFLSETGSDESPFDLEPLNGGGEN